MSNDTAVIKYRYDVVRKGDRFVVYSFDSVSDATRAVKALVRDGAKSKAQYHIEAVNVGYV